MAARAGTVKGVESMSPTIREFIKEDLIRRLGSGPATADDLTIPGLARRYGVSSTPVRAALRDLIDEGLLLKQSNGRVQPVAERFAGAGRRTPTTRPTLPSRSADLEAGLAREVIGRSLRGEGGYLREEATGRRFGVGRTAIRQVFGRLAGRGLLDFVPRCGWRVRPFDAADLRAYLDVRETLELKALELARPRLDPNELRRMLRGNVAGGDSPRIDNDIHRYLVERSENAYIRDFFDRCGDYYTTLFDFAAPETRVVAAMARQHRAILKALIARDWPRARRTLTSHIRAQEPIVLELINSLGTRSQAQQEPA
jgi:DNA-binding GntR family transcriptional regulator